jgi:hypothetical protein
VRHGQRGAVCTSLRALRQHGCCPRRSTWASVLTPACARGELSLSLSLSLEGLTLIGAQVVRYCKWFNADTALVATGSGNVRVVKINADTRLMHEIGSCLPLLFLQSVNG